MGQDICQPTDRTLSTGNLSGGGDSGACGLCGSPRHKDNDCPMKKLEEMRLQESRRGERGAVARGAIGSDIGMVSSSEKASDDSGSAYEIGVLALEADSDEENGNRNEDSNEFGDLSIIRMAEVPEFYATHYIIHKSRMNKGEL